jgi:hypothetical protein
MSSTDPEQPTNPERNLTPAEAGADGNHPSRPGADTDATPTGEPAHDAALSDTPCDAFAKACEQTLAALAGNERMDIEIRLAVRELGAPDAPAGGRSRDASEIPERMGEALVPALRWLLTQASGTIGLVAHHLESRAADIDDEARAQLRDDVVVLEDELGTVKALLAELIDWDWELGRMLNDELPPFDTHGGPYDDE